MYGAKSTKDGLVSSNDITIETDINWEVQETYPPELVGGYSEKGNSKNNTLKVSNTDIFDVFGGKSKNNGSAIGNVVQVGTGVNAGTWIGKSGEGEMVYALIAGGMVQNDSSDSVVASNRVEINATDSNNHDNYVHLVVGGQARGKLGVSAEQNFVKFLRGHVVELIGGDSWHGNAEGNRIDILGGLVATQYQLSNGSVYGGLAPEGAALNNIVSICGGKVIGDIYGGKGGSAASGNLIEVSDNPELSVKVDLSQASLFGGDAPISLNNTLSIKTSGLVVQQIGDFQNLNFEVAQAVGSTPIVKVIGNGRDPKNTEQPL